MEIETKYLEFLLNNYWCIKDQNPKEYYEIKNNLDSYKEFIRDKLGSKLIVNERFIKLEKLPALPKIYMGIPTFTDKLEYIILIIILLFLEDKPRLEQFILSNIVEYITNMAITLKLDTIPNWNYLHHRKCLVNVMNHLKKLYIIKVVEETSNFSENESAEGLYETTGISNYYIREFKNNILDFVNINDFLNDEFSNQEETIGDVRRYRVYRHLLYSLVSYKDDLTEYEIDYLRKFRNSISSEINKYTKNDLELTKNMAVLFSTFDNKEKDDFPNSKAISDIVLLVNNKIANKITEKKFSLDDSEVALISKEQLYRIIKEVKEEDGAYFSKYYRTMTQNALINEIIEYMKEYDFLKEENDNYKIYPMTSRLIGYIPKDNKSQLDLFGGLDE